MSDQQQPFGESKAPEENPETSHSTNAGKSEPDQHLTEPIFGSAEADPFSARVQPDDARAPASRIDDSVIRSSEPEPEPEPGPEPEPAASAGGGDQVWRDQYFKERKKSRLFMATTAVAVVLLFGSMFYAVAQNNATQLADLVAARGLGSPGQENGRGPGSGSPGGGQPSGRQGLSVERLFNADGSVNEELIASLRARAERFGGLGRFSDRIAAGISGAVVSGEITQEQADDLLATLDIDSHG